MIGVRIGMMVVMMLVIMSIFPLTMNVIVAMIVRMVMVVAVLLLLLALPVAGAVGVTERAAGADAFHMVMMAFLRLADIRFESENLFPVLAHLAVHQVLAGKNLANAFREGLDHCWVIIEIGRLDERNFRMAFANGIRCHVNPLDENAGEKEIGKDDDPAVSEFCRMLQGRFNQRERHARIGRFGPAETESFPQHAGDLCDIRVCIRIRCPTSDDNKKCLVQRHIVACGIERCLNPVASCADHFRVNTEFPSIFDRQSIMGRLIGVEDGGYVVLGMSGGKQHAGNRQDPVAPGFAQTIQAGMDHRVCEFQIAVVDWPVRKPAAQLVGDDCKFVDGGFDCRGRKP